MGFPPPAAFASAKRIWGTRKIASLAEGEGRTVEATTHDYLAARQPSARFIAMESVGAMVVFLASPAGQDITGATLPIDGGWAAA